MKKIRKLYQWIKANILFIVTAFIAALGSGIFWAYHNGKIRSLKTQNKIDKAYIEVAKLDTEIKILEEMKDENKKEIDELKDRRVEVIENIVSTSTEIGSMNDKEIESSFRDLY